ncbi:MetQ/NlpA family ABC transporter substrate-binding protein [Kitasatospora sp. NPDC101157]|uniref:MetQ/NlpA family ABC transporter substrate-binding protein n=1 Tax=Kitasatospora sp. NPDC101157 TaxID=3364098 RepID=UPI0038156570
MLSTKNRRYAATAVAALLATTALTACGGQGSEGAGGRIRIGISGSSSDWDVLAKKAKAEGLDVELVTFDDYSLPNKALAAGDIELNAFQHLAFLSQFNAANHTDIVPIGATAIAPLGLFSRKYKSVGELPDKAQVVIPNDPTNQGRALRVLEQAQLIRLKDDTGLQGTPEDINDNPKHLKITAVDAQQTPRALQDADGAVINNGVAGQAGIDPTTAIFQDDPKNASTRPYINVIAARAKDKDNATYRRIVELYHSPEVQKAAAEESKGAKVLSDLDPAALQAELDALAKAAKAG